MWVAAHLSAIGRSCSKLLLQWTSAASARFQPSSYLRPFSDQSKLAATSYRQFSGITTVCSAPMSRQTHKHDVIKPGWSHTVAMDKQHIRSFGSLTMFSPRAQGSDLLRPTDMNVEQVRTYKVRAVVRRRCKGCFFVKRHGRMFVECKLKPRHKQMQLVNKKSLFRDDYSKGDVRIAAFWGWQKKRIYWSGDNSQNDFKPCINYEKTSVGSS